MPLPARTMAFWPQPEKSALLNSKLHVVIAPLIDLWLLFLLLHIGSELHSHGCLLIASAVRLSKC